MAGRVVLACFLALVASPSAFGFQLTSSPMALQKSAAAVSGLRYFFYSLAVLINPAGADVRKWQDATPARDDAGT